MFEIKTLKDGLKKIAPRTKTRAITDDANKSLDTILSEKANSTDVPSKVSQLENDTGFITNAALDDYPNNTQMNTAINSHHDSTKQDKLAAQTPYTNVGSKNKIPKITTNALGQVTNVEEVDVEAQSVSLNQNLAYVNDSNIEIISAISNDIITEQQTTRFIRKKQYNRVKEGKLISNTFSIGSFLNEYFNLTNNDEMTLNIDNVLKPAILRNCLSDVERLSNINNMHTGITLSYGDTNLPDNNNTDFIVIGGGKKNSIHTQVAFNSQKIFFRVSSDGVTWNNWIEYYANKQDKLTFSATDFSVSNNYVMLNPTKFADYLLKSDAPGYADILTNANAKTTYVAKTDATGYNDILTKTEASGKYETIENANTIYETKQHATSTYETKANATATYETKANASAIYVSKTDAVGYDDILTKSDARGEYETIANASTTYETKTNASETYATKTEMTNAINSAIGTAINNEY